LEEKAKEIDNGQHGSTSTTRHKRRVMEAAKKIMAKESGYNVEPLDLIQPSKVWSTYLAKKEPITLYTFKAK
jgi:hypothetical protein